MNTYVPTTQLSQLSTHGQASFIYSLSTPWDYLQLSYNRHHNILSNFLKKILNIMKHTLNILMVSLTDLHKFTKENWINLARK